MTPSSSSDLTSPLVFTGEDIGPPSIEGGKLEILVGPEDLPLPPDSAASTSLLGNLGSQDELINPLIDMGHWT